MFSERIHRYLFLFGLFGLAFGMMLGTVPTSVPQFILLGNWFLEGQFRAKWQNLKHNRVFWILSSLFLIHVLGLLYTQDLRSGWDDVRTKIPLMFLPMILFSTPPLKEQEMKGVFYFFILGCIINVSWCHIYSFILHKNEVVRNASRFMSHIRLGLYLNLAVAVCLYLFRTSQKRSTRILFIAGIAYLLFSMYALGLASGMVNFILVTFLILIWVLLKAPAIYKWWTLVLVLLTSTLFGFYVSTVYHKQTHGENPVEKKTSTLSGRKYFHFEDAYQLENGNPVHQNIQFEELQSEWNRRCPDDSISFPARHNLHRYQILLRYMSGKGLCKDSAGIATLSNEDIQNIRNDVPNHLWPHWSFFHRRVYELINDLQEMKHGNSEGHSITMRLQFWKAAMHCIATSPIIGCGTGDVQEEMNKAYDTLNTSLSKEWRKRPHNHFLTITVALGIVGLLFFLTSLFWPPAHLFRYVSTVYFVFLALALVSFTIEDTLETQAGLTFFAFFNTLLLSDAFYKKHGIKKEYNPED